MVGHIFKVSVRAFLEVFACIPKVLTQVCVFVAFESLKKL